MNNPSPRCRNCSTRISADMFCRQCSAVIYQRIYFEDFVHHASQVGEFASDLRRNKITTAKDLAELAKSRAAKKLARLAGKCLIHDLEHPGTFARALDALERATSTTSHSRDDVHQILESATHAAMPSSV